MATRVAGDRAVSPRRTAGIVRATSESTSPRWPTPWPTGSPVTAYLHWSLVDNYEWGSYEPRFGIFGMDRSDPSGAVRWLDTDAAGDDAAGAFAHAVRGPGVRGPLGARRPA